MSAQTSRALVVVDGSRALEGNDLASAWVLRRLAALDPVVIVTSTVAGPNEEAARFAYDRDIRLRSMLDGSPDLRARFEPVLVAVALHDITWTDVVAAEMTAALLTERAS